MTLFKNINSYWMIPRWISLTFNIWFSLLCSRNDACCYKPL